MQTQKSSFSNVTRVVVATLPGLAFAWAASAGVSYEHATVVAAAPILKTVRVATPRKECWEEDAVYRRERRHDDGVGTVVGGIIGGAIGNAVGHKKRNKQVGAVVGAVLGATVGHAVYSRRGASTEHRGIEEVCEVYHDYQEEERIVGYDVRYRYDDATYTTRTLQEPGETLRIRVSVSPVI